MTQASFAITNANVSSGITKVQWDRWVKAFRQYLVENSDTAEILLRWQKAGCHPRTIVMSILQYVSGYSSERRARRNEHKKVAKKIIRAGVRSFRQLERLYLVYNQVEAANRIAEEARLAQEMLSRIESAFKAKRLGVSRSWADLAQIEGFVVEVTQKPPTPKELVSLIRAGRAAAGQKADSWETNPANIRKGLKTFKKNNPHQSSLWTNPSRRP